MSHLNIKRKLAYIPIILLFLAAGYCFRMALADVLATQVEHQLRQPNLSDAEWKVAGQILRQVLLLAPSQAASFELAGQFFQAQGYRPPLPQDTASRQESRLKALQYFRLALRHNPAWPYLWDRLALTKMTLQQYDHELSGALERIARLGPWEKTLQYDVAIIGLSASDYLDQSGREALNFAMEQSLKMQDKDTQQSLMAQFKLKKLCAGIQYPGANLLTLNQRCTEKPG